MTTKKATEGVGKKIVEALKKQSAPEIEDVQEQVELNKPVIDSNYEDIMPMENTISDDDNIDSIFGEDEIDQSLHENNISAENSFFSGSFNTNDDAQSLFQQPQQSYQQAELNTENVKVLGNLIHQLPAGISKQMGAHIIKQTMEALGISMKTVLAEAQQMQEKISLSTNDCLNSIQQYKQQIQAMEKQVQVYHKQYNSLNELISLFVQTGI